MKNSNNWQAVMDIKRELEDLKHNITGAFSKSGEVLSDKSKILLDNTIETFNERVEQITERVEKITDAVKEKSQNIDDNVRDNPWKAAGAALALGLLAGFLISRSKD
ncbi:MAG: hypothetical protein A2901_01760 [Elusimicrobia bacterium RIFCSPLOWO2_01_FULL_54_10]|nr:MAG: hypothetical protein A2901_01760 [Elusimicrobia bacterium RIFCSPLOWO2_01_FULL_54_10]